MRCRAGSGGGAGSGGPAARPCASRTRKLTFTHTDPPRISMWLQEVGHHAGVPRRGLPPPSALLGARIRRAQTACIVALGASSVLVRPTEAGTSRTQRGVEDHCSPPGKPRQDTSLVPWADLLVRCRIPSSQRGGNGAIGAKEARAHNSGPISMVFCVQDR